MTVAESGSRIHLGRSRVISLEGLSEESMEQNVSDEAGKLVGSRYITLEKDAVVVLSPNSVFSYKGIERRPLAREYWMLKDSKRENRVWRDRITTMAKRKITGESSILDIYKAVEDNAQLGISSDLIGGDLVSVNLDGGPLIARRGVYFGNGKNVRFEVASPLENMKKATNIVDKIGLVRDAVYGPGPLFQKFTSMSRFGSDEDKSVTLAFEGDWKERELARGEKSETFDPRHLYAWDEGVKLNLVPFGHFGDILFRGSIRYFVQLEGPGKFWYSDMGYGDGYIGNIATPPYWAFKVGSIFSKAVGLVNPFD